MDMNLGLPGLVSRCQPLVATASCGGVPVSTIGCHSAGAELGGSRKVAGATPACKTQVWTQPRIVTFLAYDRLKTAGISSIR